MSFGEKDGNRGIRPDMTLHVGAMACPAVMVHLHLHGTALMMRAFDISIYGGQTDKLLLN